MFQILHIFHKDGRRHWFETLASLVLLGAYAHSVLHPWSGSSRTMYANMGRYFWMNELLAPALVLFWFFLILRIVQGETLVGDRQWWVTKPYVWWKLLLSKCLFVFAAISLPLFFVQLYLLLVNGFPVLPNLLGVVRLQVGLAVSLVLIAFLLGSLTRNLAQAILTTVAFFVAAYSGIRFVVDEYGDGGAMTGPGFVPGSIEGPFWLLCAAGLLLWQYAFRRTWQSRGVLCAGAVLAVLVANLPGPTNYVESTYPLVTGEKVPAKIEMNLRTADKEDGNEDRWPEFAPVISLRIPLKISGLAQGSMLMVQGMKLTLTAPDGAVWTNGWRYSYAQAWPGGEFISDLTYGMKRQDFEKWKNLTARAHIELAMSRYVEDQPREIVLPAGSFSDAQLGICRTDPYNPSFLECLKPFHGPAYMATFDGRESSCRSENGRRFFRETVWHSWSGPYDLDFIEPGLSPITVYSVYFQEAKQNIQHELQFCEGAKIRFAYPKLGEHSRVELEIPSISVKALSKGLFSLNAISIGLRPK